VVIRVQQTAFIAVVICATVFGGADVVHGYALLSNRWPSWGGIGTTLTLTYSFQNMFDGGLRGPGAIHADGRFYPEGPPLPNDLIKHSIEQALGLWAAVVPINFVEVPDEGGAVPPLGADYSDGQFGQIRFKHRVLDPLDPTPDLPDPATPKPKAQTWFPGFGNLAGDVEFDDTDPWQEKGILHVPDILGAATHEIGHAICMAHSEFSTAVMYPVFQRFQGLGTGHLTLDDIAGIQSIYGTGLHGSVTPLPEPGTWVLAVVGVALLIMRRRNFGQRLVE
jgi:hypothetical protein